MEKAIFNTEKMYTFIKGVATGLGLSQTLIALPYARKMHQNQFRKSGEKYLSHPLQCCCHAISLSIYDDDTLATILLHDVCEDCGVLPQNLPCNDNVKRAVELLTFTILPGETKEIATARYFNLLPQSREACLTKLFDRAHNISTCAGTFTIEKLKAYIDETRRYVIPLFRTVKDAYPESGNELFVLKYHICSVVDAIELTLQAYGTPVKTCGNLAVS